MKWLLVLILLLSSCNSVQQFEVTPDEMKGLNEVNTKSKIIIEKIEDNKATIKEFTHDGQVLEHVVDILDTPEGDAIKKRFNNPIYEKPKPVEPKKEEQ